MALGLIGKKLGTNRIFNPDGDVIPVTVIEAGPCMVIQVKDEKKDHYSAVQLGFDEAKVKNVSKALQGHFRKASVSPKRVLQEFRVTPEDLSSLSPGQQMTVSMFRPGDRVDVIGVSKGRGFTGVMKRHGFHGFPGSHGTHECFRHGGSIGSRFPQGTLRGQRMAGHYGDEKTTVQNLQVVDVKEAQNLLIVRGAVPGARNGYLVIQPAKRMAKQKDQAKIA